MAWVAGAIALIAAGVSAYAASEQAAAQERAAKRQSRIEENAAEAAKLAAAADARTKERQFERQLGVIRARLGGSGTIPDEGTPLLVLMQAEEEAALDVARVRYGGAAAAHGLTLDAQTSRIAGRTARRQGQLKMTAAILQGVSSATSSYNARPMTTTPSYGTGEP